MTNEKWAEMVLSNDEVSSDEEIIKNFIENGMSEDEAKFYVNQRNRFLENVFATIIPYN